MKTCIEWNCSLHITASSGTLRIDFEIPKAEIQHLPLKGALEFNSWQDDTREWEEKQCRLIEDLYLEKRSRE